MNRTHEAFNGPPNLAAIHICEVFLKSLSCLSWDADPIGFFLSLEKPIMCVLLDIFVP
jgi:hypothetical protein